MREMKDSGVEWIGEIPKEWKICRLKNYAYIMNGADFKDIQDDNGDYPVIGSGGEFDRATKYLYDGESVLLGRKGTIDKPRYINGTFWTVDTMYYTKIKDIGIAKYLYYLCTQIQFDYYQYGSAVPSMTQRDLNSVVFPLPEIVEQENIVNYLDSKCSKIDEIIEKQQAIIEKLKEYKISIITEVVTKGLDYEADYKESGTEWLGKIPSHWQYLSFKNVLKERNEKNFPVKTAERLSLSIDKGVTLYSEKTTNLDRFKDDVSQYKLAHEGDFVLNSMNMIVGAVGISHYFGCVSPAYYTYYDNEEDHITAKYCDYLFHSKTVKKVLHSLGKGIMSIDRGDDRINTCRLKVSRTDLRALKIPVPPICEQREIVKYLQSKENLIDKTIADRNKAIDKLQEYKKCLIYEVVTGKKEV